MMPELPDTIVCGILDRISCLPGLSDLDLSRVRVSAGDIKGDFYPADVTFKAVIPDGHGRGRAFLLVSNPAGPTLVAQNVHNAEQIRTRLGNSLGSVIDLPLARGDVDGISWALFSYNTPLTSHRIGWVIQRTWLTPFVLSWLTRAMDQTRIPMTDEASRIRLTLALERLAGEPDLDSYIRNTGQAARKFLDAGQWHPVCCVSHNDLWQGNIMVPPRGRFRIIDWAGAREAGLPFFDLVTFCRSFQVPRQMAQIILVRQCRVLGCSREEAGFHLVAALAVLGDHLDRFPRPAYLRLCHDMMATFARW